MDSTVTMLESYRGRDKIIRTLYYGLHFASGFSGNKGVEKIDVLSRALSGTRVILRMFDDLSMLKWTMSYGFGRQEKDWRLRLLNLVDNVAGQLYYPLEHVAWFAEQQIIKANAGKWWTLSIVSWAVSLVVGILRGFLTFLKLRTERQKLVKLQRGDSSSTATTATTADIKRLRGQEFLAVLSVTKSAADLANAVHWLPPGCLWATKLSRAQVGFFGLVSSLIGLYEAASSGGSASPADT